MRGPGLLTAQAAEEGDAPDDEQLGLQDSSIILCVRDPEKYYNCQEVVKKVLF